MPMLTASEPMAMAYQTPLLLKKRAFWMSLVKSSAVSVKWLEV